MRAANYLDLAPYRRSTVGFDRLLDLMNNAAPDAAEHYPPFDIERRADGAYRISVAVPGFRPDELEVVAQQNMLTVSGRKPGGEPQATYLHQGISSFPARRLRHRAVGRTGEWASDRHAEA